MKINLSDILGILFIALKLTNYITWTWWWVLAPFWIQFVVSFVVILIKETKKSK